MFPLWLLALSVAQPAYTDQIAHEIVFFGDSLPWGVGVADPHRDAYPGLIARVLPRRDHLDGVQRVVYRTVADPGATAAWGREHLESHVLRSPETGRILRRTVVVQFGGNDSRGEHPLSPDYFADVLRDITATCQAAGSEVILCIPPFQLGRRDANESRYIQAIEDCGKTDDVPVVDLDAALRAAPGDVRGPFPMLNWGHPNWYGHSLMAQALCRALPEGGGPTVSIEPSVTLMPVVADDEPAGAPGRPEGGTVELRVHVGGEARVWVEGASGQQDAAPDAAAVFQALLPPPGVPGPLLAVARTRDGATGFAAGRVVTGRVIACADAPEWPESPDSVNPSRGGVLGRERVRRGLAAWSGPEDCSAAFQVARAGAELVFSIRVWDDSVSAAPAQWLPDSDCVELAFDLNPLSEQALPYFTDRSGLLFVSPPADRGPEAVIGAAGSLPDGFSARAQHAALEGGYGLRVHVSIPGMRLDGGTPGIGFDLLVDDSDGVVWRQSQLVWHGDADAALTTEGYGFLALEPLGDGDLVRVAVH